MATARRTSTPGEGVSFNTTGLSSESNSGAGALAGSSATAGPALDLSDVAPAPAPVGDIFSPDGPPIHRSKSFRSNSGVSRGADARAGFSSFGTVAG
jgi:hypothetical protein